MCVCVCIQICICVGMYVYMYVCVYVLIPIYMCIALRYTSDFSIWESESSVTFCNGYNEFLHQVLASILIQSRLSKAL